jgi:hypothetical protein
MKEADSAKADHQALTDLTGCLWWALVLVGALAVIGKLVRRASGKRTYP